MLMPRVGTWEEYKKNGRKTREGCGKRDAWEEDLLAIAISENYNITCFT